MKQHYVKKLKMKNKIYLLFNMEVKFNSLFDSQFNENSAEYYGINRKDDMLELNDLILTFDKEKLKATNDLAKRNFGNVPNYLLSGRSCSTSLCTSNKYCDSSGWPEVFKDTSDKCNLYFSPNSDKSDPYTYIKNIDLESRLKNVDYNNNKCNYKKKDFKLCNKNDKRCEENMKNLECYGDILSNDNFNININTTNERNSSNSSNNSNCLKNNDIDSELIKNKYEQPTKRINVIPW